MATKLFLVFVIIFSSGLLIEARRIACKHQIPDELDLSTESELIDDSQHFGSVFNRRKRSTESHSSESDQSGHLTSAEAVTLLRVFGTLAWEANKGSFLTGLIEQFADSDSNITIVGWQQIYNAQGEVTDLHAIEFIIPPKPESDEVGNFQQDDDEEDEEDWDDLDSKLIPHSKINELREILEPFSLINVDGAVLYTHFDAEGKPKELLYINEDELYIEVDEYSMYNKTVNDATPEQINHLINVAKTYPDTSILKYDAEGKLVKDQSTINPLNLVTLVDIETVNDTVIMESPNVFTNVLLENDAKHVPKALVQKFGESFPEYQWRLIIDPANYFLTRDTAIIFKFDSFNFHDAPEKYYLYGVQKA